LNQRNQFILFNPLFSEYESQKLESV